MEMRVGLKWTNMRGKNKISWVINLRMREILQNSLQTTRNFTLKLISSLSPKKVQVHKNNHKALSITGESSRPILTSAPPKSLRKIIKTRSNIRTKSTN